MACVGVCYMLYSLITYTCGLVMQKVLGNLRLKAHQGSSSNYPRVNQELKKILMELIMELIIVKMRQSISAFISSACRTYTRRPLSLPKDCLEHALAWTWSSNRLTWICNTMFPLKIRGNCTLKIHSPFWTSCYVSTGPASAVTSSLSWGRPCVESKIGITWGMELQGVNGCIPGYWGAQNQTQYSRCHS